MRKLFENPQLIKPSGNSWRFEFPSLYYSLDDKLEEAIDILYSDSLKSIKILIEIIKSYPYHIDAYHHLANAYFYCNKIDDALINYEKAFSIGSKCFPNKKDFQFGRDLIEWGYIENRPFLRAMHGLSIACWYSCKKEKSILLWEKMLKLNPIDNQGIRILFAISCLEFQRYDELIILSNNFGDGIGHDVEIALSLIYFIKHDLEKAKYYLRNALRYNMEEIKSLLKRNITEPDLRGSYDNGMIICNKDYSIYEFYKWNHKYWKEVPGALDFLKSNI